MKSYLITDPKYYTEDISTFEKKLAEVFGKTKVDFALYRDKENHSYAEFAERFILACKKFGVKPMLHQDAALAKLLGAYGVHLTSRQLEDVEAAKSLGLFTVASTHTYEELEFAASKGADAVTYSPIFATPNKGEPKGLDDLCKTVRQASLNIIALGGITTDEEVKAVEKCGVFAFASIRYFL